MRPGSTGRASLLMENDVLVTIFNQIADDPYLPKQVLFFLQTLAEDTDTA